MATVNVTTANTFEEWRVKTNEVGTAIGNLSNLTVSDTGATTLVAAVNLHQDIVAGTLASSGGTMTGDLILGDNVKLEIGSGAGGDLQLYHDGSNSYIVDGGTGNLKIYASQLDIIGTAETLATFVDDGAVTLYNDNVARIATNATGVDVTGVITADGLDIEDDHIIKIGTSDDLSIKHASGNTSLTNITGQLRIGGNDIRLQTQNHSEDYILCVDGGAVELYHNDVKKFETTAAGVAITGAATISTTLGVTGILTGSAAIIGTTVEPTGDTAAGDNAAIGYTSAAGLILTGQGSTNDITVKNDANATVISIPTGTTNVNVVGALDAATLKYGGTDVYSTATFTEAVADTIGAMVGSNTESGISVTYDDSDNTLDFDVIDPVITLSGAVEGSGTMTNLGSFTITTTSGAGNIVTADIADSAVTTVKIADNAITKVKMGDDAVGHDELENVQTLILFASAPATATAQVNGAVSSSTALQVDTNSGTIAVGMIVSGTGVSGQPSIITVTDQNNLVLSHAQTIANNVALTFTQSLKILRTAGDA